MRVIILHINLMFTQYTHHNVIYCVMGAIYSFMALILFSYKYFFILFDHFFYTRDTQPFSFSDFIHCTDNNIAFCILHNIITNKTENVNVTKYLLNKK